MEFCAEPPASGVLLPDTNPVPIANFPLVGDSLSSWPHTDYVGASDGVQSVPDELFISAQECQKGVNNFLSFDSVPYASNGTFAINIWIRAANMSGPIFQYVYVHSQFPPAAYNQRIQIYLPESDHGLYGIVRTLIRDSMDPPTQVYLDSNNLVSNVDYRIITDKTVVNGEWHMITVTTHKDFSPGYSVYIDGVLVADHSIDNPGQVNEVFGGDPLDLDDRILLCGRYDQDANRHFNGRVSQLSLYDTPLTMDQIQELYKMVVPEVVFEPPQELPVGPPESTVPENLDVSQCVFPFIYKGVRFFECAFIDGMYECQDYDKNWVLCSQQQQSSPTASPTQAPNPECIFPFLYSTKIYNECIPIAGVLRCQNQAQEFIECYPENVTVETPITELGSP